jgi:hypothetical protein
VQLPDEHDGVMFQASLRVRLRDRGFASLAGEMLDWVIANWRERGCSKTLKTEVHEH